MKLMHIGLIILLDLTLILASCQGNPHHTIIDPAIRDDDIHGNAYISGPVPGNATENWQLMLSEEKNMELKLSNLNL